MTEQKINCIVVDDSPLQRLSIGKLVADHPSLELVQTFGNAFTAKTFLQEESIDLVILDVEMPIFSGFDLLDKLEEKPQVIFVTGKTQHAFRAFNYEAIDFLQKPVDRNRFDRAIQKMVTQITLQKDATEMNEGNYIFIKSKLKKYKVFVDNIKYVLAMGDYVKVVTYDESYEVLSTMKGFEKILPENRFLRVHKSYVINLSKVKSYGSKWIQLEQEEIPLSRHRKEGLQQALSAISSAEISTDQHSE